MRKLFTSIIILFLACSFVGIHAQGTGSATARITVNIIPGTEVNTISDLDFGNVDVNSGINTLAVSDEAAGRFLITGAENAGVTIALNAPATLTDGRDHSIPFTPALAYAHPESPAGFTPIDPFSPPPLRLVKNDCDLSGGSFYISVSGSIDVGNIPDGTYSGIVTLSATYN
ncbi:MAG: hypothetical protein ACNA8K_12675 [Cyclonatronaceae bacterium]